jgi:protein TonB
VSRSLGSALLLLVAALTTACAERETTRAAGTVGPVRPAESPLAGQRFSLMDAKLNRPPLPEPGPSSGDQAAVPLDPTDPRYGEYFAELKRRIEAKWSYPREASLRGQSGKGEIRFVLRRDGSVETVEIVKSTGVDLLDSHIRNAIHEAQPFPPIPASIGGVDTIPISINFNYTLGPGLRPSP